MECAWYGNGRWLVRWSVRKRKSSAVGVLWTWVFAMFWRRQCVCVKRQCVFACFRTASMFFPYSFDVGGHCGYFNPPWVPINKCLKHTVHNYVHTWASIRVLWHVSSTAQKVLWQWANHSRAPQDSAEGVQWHLWFIPWGGIVIWSSAAAKCRRSAGNTVDQGRRRMPWVFVADENAVAGMQCLGMKMKLPIRYFFSLLMSVVTGNCYLGCVFSKYSVSCYCRHGGSRQRKPDMFLSWPTQMALRLVSWGQCLLRIDELACFVLECCILHYYLGCVVF